MRQLLHVIRIRVRPVAGACALPAGGIYLPTVALQVLSAP